MRFMPLIECFLTVCGTTSLRVPALTENVVENTSIPTKSSSSSEISPLGKRKSSYSESPVIRIDSGDKVDGQIDMETVLDSSEIDSTAIIQAVRALSDTVPGARFRNNVGYLQMQLELDDTAPAAPLLLHFVDRNRVLINMVLKNNVHLLESSFSALVITPRCRHLLHFDIKRFGFVPYILFFSALSLNLYYHHDI